MPPLDLSQDIAPVSLRALTEPELIFPALQGRDPAGIIAELSRGLQQRGVIADVLPFYQAALNRELLHDSALDHDVAVPHVRLPGNARLCFAFGRCAEPVAWGGQFARHVRFVFLIAVPLFDAGGYLKLLSAVARFSQHPANLDRLAAARGPQELLQTLAGF